MQAAEELDLLYLPFEDDAFAADPVPHFAAARERHPWLARWANGYVITQYQAIRDFYRMDDRMSAPFDDIVALMGAENTPWGTFQNRHMLNQSGASHKRIRDLLAPAFTPRQANLHRPLMRKVIAELLDEWAPKGAFDFEEFASYFPIRVMCSLIGAPASAIPGLRSSLETMGLSTSMERKYLPALQEAVLLLDVFVHRLVGDRRERGPSEGERDLLDVLLEAQHDGGLTDRELADILIFLFVAGYDTSKNVLTLIMYEMLDRPEVYRRCAEDSSYCRKVIEETLRFHGTVSSQRILDEDIVYRDVRLPQGAMVWYPLSIATRDPSAVEDPEEFLPERRHDSTHVVFGLGPHICLGQFIARTQIEEGLHQIARRLTNPRSPGPDGWRPFGVWGIRGLPIEFGRP